jgi:selenide,water dikinase
VFRLDDETALIQTVDFFPPIVDDPYAFGQIAVANALSDVYAMGGKPIIALNIVGFPVALPKDILGSILVGGAHKAQEAGVLIVGGHTVDDEEPKYGLSVTGIVKPGAEVTNAGAQPGDRLVLTKPIGTGVITTAGKQGVAGSDVIESAVEIMGTLNSAACHAMTSVGVHGCVDVTGFGLLGHLRGMTRASGVSASVDLDAIPFIPGVRELAEQGIAPGGTHRNLESLGPDVTWDDSITDIQKILLADAQTSGGLLISVPDAETESLLTALEDHGVETRAVIGSISELGVDSGPSIHVSS